MEEMIDTIKIATTEMQPQDNPEVQEIQDLTTTNVRTTDVLRNIQKGHTTIITKPITILEMTEMIERKRSIPMKEKKKVITEIVAGVEVIANSAEAEVPEAAGVEVEVDIDQ